MVLAIIVFCAIGFLVGGIPFGYLTGRLVLKDDIRKHGSGNIGATNVARILGWKWGFVVLFLDALKGLLPTLAAAIFLNEGNSEALVNLAAILTGICCILGHMYPIWLRLRGGKGVATGLGVVLVIAPFASGVASAAFLIVFALKRIVGLASVVAAVAFSITQLVRLGADAWAFEQLPMTLFSTLVPALIVWKHRSNLVRILRGNEPPMKMRSTDTKTDAEE